MLEPNLNPWIWLCFGAAVSIGLTLFYSRSRRSASRSTLLEKVAVMPLSHVRQDMREELGRARRYRRRLAVAVIGLGSRVQKPSHCSPKIGKPGCGSRQCPQPEALEEAFLVLGSILSDLFRIDDIVAYSASRDQFVLLLLECSHAEAIRALRRAQALVRKRTHIEIDIGVAEFPSEGLILRDLIGHAEQALSGVSAIPSRKALAQTHAS